MQRLTQGYCHSPELLYIVSEMWTQLFSSLQESLPSTSDVSKRYIATTFTIMLLIRHQYQAFLLAEAFTGSTQTKLFITFALYRSFLWTPLSKELCSRSHLQLSSLTVTLLHRNLTMLQRIYDTLLTKKDTALQGPFPDHISMCKTSCVCSVNVH